MSFFQVKALLAIVFVAAGLTAALSMLSLLGRTERKISVAALKGTHRVAGYAFAGFFAVLAVMGTRFLAAAGDGLNAAQSRPDAAFRRDKEWPDVARACNVRATAQLHRPRFV